MEKIYQKSVELENKGIVKFILFIIIIFTLLPVFKKLNQLTGNILTYIFFSLFFIESVFRLIILMWGIKNHITGKKTKQGGWKALVVETALWLVDLLATISFLEFLPLGEALRFLRLLRLIKLSRYFSSFFLELGQILNRRSIRRQFIIVFVLLFSISIVVGLIFFIAEDADVVKYAWWSFKTLFDPGEMLTYEDIENDSLIENEEELNDDTEGIEDIGKIESSGAVKTLFSIILTIIGLLLLSFFIGIGTQVVENLIEITKNKKLNYKGHIIIFGWTRGAETILREILNNIEDNQLNKKIVLLQDVNRSLEDSIELNFRQVTSRYKNDTTLNTLVKCGVKKADMIMIFGQSTIIENDDPDIIKKILTAREIGNPNLYTVSMLKDERNFIPAKEVGSDIVIIRSLFLGFYMCQNILKPELKEFYHEVLTSTGSEFYTYELKTKINDNNKNKKIPYNKLYMKLLEKGCTFIGVIRKKAQRLDEDDKNSPYDISDDKFIVNPMQYFDTDKKEMVFTNGFMPEEVEHIVCLTKNKVALNNIMSEIQLEDLIETTRHETDADNTDEKTKKLLYSDIERHSIGNILIFGWNNTVPSLIQQLSSYVSFDKGVTIYLHSEYGYEDEDIKIMYRKIKELLMLYYDKEITIELISSINFAKGDYFSQTEIFDVNLGNLSEAETIIVIPDNRKADNPDADVFLILLTILGIIKRIDTRVKIKNYERLRVYAQVSDDTVGKKLDKILEKVNPKVRTSTGITSNKIIDRFNIIYSEKSLNLLLVQHLTNKYTQLIFHDLITNDDMNTVIILSENFIQDVDLLKSKIQDDVIRYEDICEYLLQYRITPLGYQYIDSKGNISLYINPKAEERSIHINENYPCLIVIGNNENDLIKKFDRNR